MIKRDRVPAGGCVVEAQFGRVSLNPMGDVSESLDGNAGNLNHVTSIESQFTRSCLGCQSVQSDESKVEDWALVSF